MAFPDYEKEFIVYTDGSKEMGLGVALYQVDDEGVERPILYLSRELKLYEKNYYVTELETLCVIWGLVRLSHYLKGTKPFRLITDHSALVSYLQGNGKRSQRLENWKMELST